MAFRAAVGATTDFVLIDIDEDGDLDLVHGGRDGVSLLEQHESKWIARPRAVASFASGLRRLLRVDDDRDGDVDVLAVGSRSGRLRNRSVDLAMPYRPRIGRSIPVDLTLRNRGADRSSVRVFTSFQEIVGGIPGRFGIWGLDPSKQIELTPLEFKGSEGELRLELEIPDRRRVDRPQLLRADAQLSRLALAQWAAGGTPDRAVAASIRAFDRPFSPRATREPRRSWRIRRLPGKAPTGPLGPMG